MIVDRDDLNRFFTGANTSFARGLGTAAPRWDKVATRVPSATREEKYGRLGKLPRMREWIGGRVIDSVVVHDHTIRNRGFENAIEVDRNDVEDDGCGIYAPLFEEMGRDAAVHPNEEPVFGLLKAGFSTLCYDGQRFFDTDRPALDAAGTVASDADGGAGAGAAWFLIDAGRALKPLVLQMRKDPTSLARKDREEDDDVFGRRTFRCGVRGRHSVGFGSWRFAWGGRRALSKANHEIAREAVMGLKGDFGRPLGLMPRLPGAPPSLEGRALEIANSERDAAGAANVRRGAAEPLVAPWLA